MKKIIFVQDGQRIDRIDAEAIHTLSVGEHRRTINQLVTGGSRLVVSGFATTLSGGGAPKQVTVTLGALVSGELFDDGTIELGQLVTEGTGTQLWDFAGSAAGTYSLWVKFRYDPGDLAKRAYLQDVPGSPPRERTVTVNTRAVPDWSLTATDDAGAGPGSPWVRVARVVYTGADLDAGDIVEARELLFEGQGDADGWTFPDFDRGDDRAVDGVTNLRDWIWAANKRLEELGGAAWQKAPTFGENVRSASSAVTVSADADLSAHLTLAAPTPASFASLFALAGNSTNPRAAVAFVPTALGARQVYDIDTTATEILAASSTTRRISGPATIRRTEGDLPVLKTVTAFRATVEGVKFDATKGGGAIVELNGASDQVRFVDCEFADAGGTALALVNMLSAGTYEFVNCTFTAAANGIAVRVNAAATVLFVNCTFNLNTTAIGLTFTAVPAAVRALGCLFSGGAQHIVGTLTGTAAKVTLLANRHSGASGEDVRVTGPFPGVPDLYFSGTGGFGGASDAFEPNGAVAAQHGDFYSVRARERVMIDAAQDLDAAPLTQSRFIEILESDHLTGRDRDNVRLAAYFRRVVADVAVLFGALDEETTPRLELTAGGANPVVSLLDSADTEDPTAALLHVHGLHLGTTDRNYGKVVAGMVPLGWGFIQKTSGDDAATYTAKWLDKDGYRDLGAACVFAYDGTSDCHMWTVIELPPSYGASVAYITVQASIHSLDHVEGIGADGIPTHRLELHTAYDSPYIVFRPIVIAADGTLDAIRATNTGIGNHDFAVGPFSTYRIEWCVFANVPNTPNPA